MVVLVTLVGIHVLTPDEGLSGFSNQATITIAAMFVLSAALKKTGFVSAIGLLSARLFQIHFSLGLLAIMVLVSLLSAFINNTPVVAIFIPIMLNVTMKTSHAPSRLLIPLSYASIFGGVCTLSAHRLIFWSIQSPPVAASKPSICLISPLWAYC